MTTPVDFDVLIVGANLVGASLALSLSQQGRRVALIDL
ncbi:MAG: FAD-dependent monooxygenase, partial [Neisseriaceae bacterium]|nr:FAD-dependent monooxygenase [Neisseriaceae bacterium]